MADGDPQPREAATEGGQASALAMLAESSAARSTQGEGERRLGDAVEMQRVREKLEAARARVGTALAEIPTGREYDAPPDASDEPVYDALEKAYNAAFTVHPPVETQRGQEEQREETTGSGESNKAAETAVGAVDKSGEDKQTPQIGTLKSMCLSTLKQNGDGNGEGEASRAQEKANLSASPPVPSSGPGSESKLSSSDVAERTVTPASLSAGSVATTASPPQSPASVPNRTSSEDGFVSTPEMKRESHDVSMKPEEGEEARVERADHLSLNEFLITELEIYCSCLLERGSLEIGSSDVSGLARITGLQLYQDHHRALMDFDDEWKRSHADRYRGYTQPNSQELLAAPRTAITNPFQQNISHAKSLDEWATLLNGVKVFGTRSTSTDTHHSLGGNGKEGSEDLFAAFKRGSNGIVVSGDSGYEKRLQISTFMTQIASSQSTSALNIVVAGGSDLASWERALSSKPLIQLYPYWGIKEDRQNLLQLLSNEYFTSCNLSVHVLLTSYEVFMEDISVVASLQCQISVIDIPGQAIDKIASLWPQLLSLQCRQRLLMCRPTFETDARKLLHFLIPELFSSRRKLLAWNSAALHTDQIRAVCDVVRTFMVVSDVEASSAFISKVESCTQDNSEHEMAALDTLHKQGIVRAVPSIVVPVRRMLIKKSRNRPFRHTPVKGKLSLQTTVSDPVDAHLTIKAPNVLLKKRRGSDVTPGSRQRIGRCGKCSGCLAEDCMKCGHCQDMKKYGGPGLRKQSCKNRKCLNPKIWGYASRKRKRSKTKRTDVNSVKGSSEIDDDASVPYSSVESDGESVSTATYENDYSDEESLQYSDATMDSPRDLLLPASDTLLDDHLSLSDLSSRSSSARSRVVRCGECDGCNAPDCMKCPHCLDMKKYGGPGLRKQTCKNRKCNAPKIVMLNQGKGDHYVDEKGNVVYSGLSDGTFPEFYEAPDSSDRGDAVSAIAESPKVGNRSDSPSVLQECERFLKSRLIFACIDCAARFSSSKVLSLHARVEHPSSAGQGTLEPTVLEREASRLFLGPIFQNAMLCAQLNQKDISSPLGYAKLQGKDFQYFFIEPFVVLGRMESRWCNLYKGLGFGNVRGLAGGDVDCHVGNDSMIATRHAVISWDARAKSFMIECLSLQTRISVNGREVSFSSPPTALSSRNLVQIGASIFYFLLPKASTASSVTVGNTTPRA